MSVRLDASVSDYANQPVVAGTPVTLPLVPLYGSIGWSMHAQCSNGAAGTLVCYVTNYGPEVVVPGGVPFSQLTSDTIAANGAKFSGFSTGQTGETFARFLRYVFTPSASGYLNIALNVRRISG